MDLMRIVLIAIAAAVLALFLKQFRPEFSVFISIVAGAIIFLGIVPHIFEIFDLAYEFAGKSGLDAAYLTPVLKIIGITYVTGYGCELCRDAGFGALAAKLEMAGKVIALALALPIVRALFDTLIGIMP